jgi:hypothetical protein
MSAKNLNRRQILTASAALAAPVLALTTPTHAHAWLKWNTCTRQGITWKKLLASITWSKSISNVLGTKASIKLGTRPNIPGNYMEVTMQILKKTAVAYYYSQNSSNSNGQSITLYQIDEKTCNNTALTTVKEQRCLVFEVDPDNDPSSEALGPRGVPSKPWLLNSTDRQRLTGALAPNRATNAGSAQRYRALFGWIEYEQPVSNFITITYRRMWAWDPAINGYSMVEFEVRFIRDGRLIPRAQTVSTEQFNNFSDHALMLYVTLNTMDMSAMPFWDPVLLISEGMRNYDNGATLLSSARQLAILSNLGESGVRGFNLALRNYRDALTIIRELPNERWIPNTTGEHPANQPDPGDLPALIPPRPSAGSHCSFNSELRP